MNDNSLRGRLTQLGLRQADLARLLDVSARTVNQWASKAQPLPGAVAGYLRLLEAAGPDLRQSELSRLEDRSKHLDEGVYAIVYRNTAEGFLGQGMALLRRGRVVGSDFEGNAFSGDYRHDRAKGVNVINLNLETLGLDASRDGISPLLVERAQPVATSTMTIGAEVYELELRFLGPLPD